MHDTHVYTYTLHVFVQFIPKAYLTPHTSITNTQICAVYTHLKQKIET